MIGPIITLGLGSFSTSKYVVTLGLLGSVSSVIPIDGITTRSVTIKSAHGTGTIKAATGTGRIQVF